MAKTTKAPARPRSDGWRNIYTGLGGGRDKRLGARFLGDRLDEATCEELWLGDDIAARIIEAQPEAELRQGFEIVVSDASSSGPPVDPPRIDSDDDSGAELGKELAAYFEERDVTATLLSARQFARAYGGGAILLGAQDGQRFDQPLKESAIKTVPWLKVLRPSECWPARYYRSPESKKFGEVSVFRVVRDTLGGSSSQMLEVHESRIIPFYGVVVSTRQRAARMGWGSSVLERVIEKVSDFQASFQAAGVLVQDFAQAVFKMAGLAELLMQGEGGDATVIDRARAIDMARGVARALIIDKDEEFRRETTPVAGLAELMDRLTNRLAAAARMPVTVMMGTAPAGLNATGASDIRNWYDQIAGEREAQLRPRHNRLLRVLMLAKDSPTKGREPRRWTIRYPSLWQLTEAEEAELRGKVATADTAYISAGVLMPEEVAASRFGGDRWTMETQLDMKARAVAPPADVPEPDPTGEPEDEPADGEPPTKGAPTKKGDSLEDEVEITASGEKATGPGIDLFGAIRPPSRFDFDEGAIERDESGRFAGGAGSIGTTKKDVKAARAEIKRGALPSAAAKLGGDKATAERLIEGWQDDSSRGEAIAFKAAVARELGIDPAKDLERTKSFLKASGVSNAEEHVAKQVAKSEDKKVRATVRAIAQASQAAHEGDTVKLYRGVNGKQAEELRAFMAANPGAPVPFNTDSMASFTESASTARVFGHGGFIVEVDVPRSSIVLSHRASKSLSKFGDSEVVIATLGRFNIDPSKVTAHVPEKTKSWAEIQAEIAAGK
ncbi:MAG: anti-CBASS protein Acb1 family protein [Myxococcota bacterium]